MTVEEREKRDQETHDAVIEMRAVILGLNGRGGLLDQVNEVILSVREMKLKCGAEELNVANLLQDVPKIKYRLSRIELILAFAAGSGALGGGIYGVIKLFGG